jgi:tetratricopeptide (TPR) repeat protein
MAGDKQSEQTPLAASPAQATRGQLWQVPVFVLGVLTIFGVWASRPFWYDPDGRWVQRSLLEARRTLEDPRAPANELPALLTQALNRVDRLPALRAETHYLLGWAYARLAGPITAGQSTELWRQAREHLETADRLGVAEGDHPLLQFLLAKAWAQTGGDPQRIIDYLSQSIDQAADDRAEGYAMLTQAYLRLPEPDLPSALLANRKQLDQPTSDESRLAPARLLRGELLLRLQDRAEARKVLSRIGASAPLTVLSRARRLRARSYQDDQAWAEAAQAWETILSDRRDPAPEDAPRILFSLGWCYRNLRRTADATRVWEQVSQSSGEDAQAASLRLAELMLDTGERTRALKLLETALAGLTKPEDYHNSLVDLTQARRILETGCRTSKEAGDFAIACTLARLHGKLAAPGPSHILLAQASEAWAMFQREQAKKTRIVQDAQWCEEAARVHFQEAATAYEAAAEAEAGGAVKPDCLWRAALNYEEGRDFTRAVLVLNRYLTLPPPPDRLGEAWYRLGLAHQALHNTAGSAISFKKCIEAQSGAFAFRARYELAIIELREGHADEALETLQQNLKLMVVVADPEAHEKSLFALADLLYRRGQYGVAAFHWEQALTLYPGNPDASMARYRLADCYYHRAREEIKSSLPGEVSAPQSLKQYRLWLEKAAANYQKLASDLEARRAKISLSGADSALLAQALFGVANCRLDLGAYDEAIRLYDNLANRYQHQTEGLIAARRLYWCYLADISSDPLHQNARASLERVKLLFYSLDERAFVGRSDLESRSEFEKWLKDAQQQMDKMTPKGP